MILFSHGKIAKTCIILFARGAAASNGNRVSYLSIM